MLKLGLLGNMGRIYGDAFQFILDHAWHLYVHNHVHEQRPSGR